VRAYVHNYAFMSPSASQELSADVHRFAVHIEWPYVSKIYANRRWSLREFQNMQTMLWIIIAR